jgi:uncharacterized membrane protein YqjE
VNSRDDDRPRGPVRQLIASVSGLLATALHIGRTRLELLTVELREEVHRTAEQLVLGLATLLAAAAGVLFAGLAIIFAFWDTHRILAAVLVTLGFFALAAVTALLLRSRLRARPRFLQATLAELAQDEIQLRGRSR